MQIRIISTIPQSALHSPFPGASGKRDTITMSAHINAIASSSKPSATATATATPKPKKSKHGKERGKSSTAVNGQDNSAQSNEQAAANAGDAAEGHAHRHHHHHKKHHKSGKDRKDKIGGGSSSHADKLEKWPFQHQRSCLRMSIAPKFAADQLAGVKEGLDTMVMR